MTTTPDYQAGSRLLRRALDRVVAEEGLSFQEALAVLDEALPGVIHAAVEMRRAEQNRHRESKKRVQVGDTLTVKLPFSEVCMHLQVAGKKRPIHVLQTMTQILNEDGTPFSIPVTHGEAGLYSDAEGLYVLPDQLGVNG